MLGPMSVCDLTTPDSACTDTLPAAGADATFTVSAVLGGSAISWLSVTGKLVGDAAASCLAAALERQRTAGCRFVRLDLSELSMLDHAGFDVLADAHDQFLTVGGALVMTGVCPRIARLFQLTGLDKILFAIAQSTDPPPAEADSAVVDRAVGMVMGRGRCGVTEATEHLTTLARATNRTLGDVARSLLDEHANSDRARVTYA